MYRQAQGFCGAADMTSPRMKKSRRRCESKNLSRPYEQIGSYTPICACQPSSDADASSSSPSTPAHTSFRFHKTTLAGVRTLKYRAVTSSGDELTYGRALELLADTEEHPEFTQALITTLRDVPFPAFFFETPPVTHQTLHSRPFEFVLVDAPVLARVITGADPSPFQEHLDRAREEQGEHGVATFPSLGRDATLIAPVQSTEVASSFTHLAQFTRHAPAEQVMKLWTATAVAMQRGLQEARRRPLWLSTSGLGVHWLHMRIDTRPKYYTFDEYKSWSESADGGAT